MLIQIHKIIVHMTKVYYNLKMTKLQNDKKIYPFLLLLFICSSQVSQT